MLLCLSLCVSSSLSCPEHAHAGPAVVVAGMAQRSGGIAQYVVDGEDVALKAGYLKKCALSTGAILKCVTPLDPAQTRCKGRLQPCAPLLNLWTFPYS